MTTITFILSIVTISIVAIGLFVFRGREEKELATLREKWLTSFPAISRKLGDATTESSEYGLPDIIGIKQGFRIRFHIVIGRYSAGIPSMTSFKVTHRADCGDELYIMPKDTQLPHLISADANKHVCEDEGFAEKYDIIYTSADSKILKLSDEVREIVEDLFTADMYFLKFHGNIILFTVVGWKDDGAFIIESFDKLIRLAKQVEEEVGIDPTPTGTFDPDEVKPSDPASGE